MRQRLNLQNKSKKGSKLDDSVKFQCLSIFFWPFISSSCVLILLSLQLGFFFEPSTTKRRLSSPNSCHSLSPSPKQNYARRLWNLKYNKRLLPAPRFNTMAHSFFSFLYLMFVLVHVPKDKTYNKKSTIGVSLGSMRTNTRIDYMQYAHTTRRER